MRVYTTQNISPCRTPTLAFTTSCLTLASQINGCKQKIYITVNELAHAHTYTHTDTHIPQCIYPVNCVCRSHFIAIANFSSIHFFFSCGANFPTFHRHRVMNKTLHRSPFIPLNFWPLERFSYLLAT